MKCLSLVLMLVCVFMVYQSEAAPNTNAAVIFINYGTHPKELLPYIKSLLSELKTTKWNKGGNKGPVSTLTHNCPKKVPKNCAEVLKCGGKTSGVYTFDPDGKGPFKVYCDQKTNGGGWTVFQKRQDGSVSFFRGWNDYKKGFGDLRGEFWLGLDNINRLTHQTRNRLRVELEDWKGKSAYAEYDYFAVSSERSKYKLSLGKYSGTAGDSLSYHRGMPFSTNDRDNDKWSKHCAHADYNKGAWWYKICHYANLNGLYHHGIYKGYDGVIWCQWKGKGCQYSAKRAEMKIRPV